MSEITLHHHDGEQTLSMLEELLTVYLPAYADHREQSLPTYTSEAHNSRFTPVIDDTVIHLFTRQL